MNQAKAALVLLPGAMSGVSSWHYQLQEFSKDRPVYVPERHRHLSTIAQMARHLVEELPPEFDLVAWSMGGYIAFELSRLAGGRIRKLVLLSTSAQPESAEARRARMTLIRVVQNEGLPAAWDRLFASAFVHPERVPQELRERLRAEYLMLGMDIFRSQAEAIMERRDARPLLPCIQSPTLVLVGERDTVTPVERSKEIVSLIPGSILAVLQHVGHNSPLEAPDVVNRHLIGFLDNQLVL